MKTGLQAFGYTIVEVMVVLGVTAILVVSAMIMVGGQQQKTQFTQSIHDIQSQINETINNVANGYYSRADDNLTCSVSVLGPKFSLPFGTKDRGTNQDCVVLGRAMQFGAPNQENFNIVNLAGLQQIGGVPVETLGDSLPVAMSPADPPILNSIFPVPPLTDTRESDSLQYGLQTHHMYYTDAAGINRTTSMVAFVTDFPDDSAAQSAESRSFDLYAIDNTATSTGPVNNPTSWTPKTPIQAVDAIDTHAGAPPYNFKKANSVTICFVGGTGKVAMITIGGNTSVGGNAQLAANLTFGVCT